MTISFTGKDTTSIELESSKEPIQTTTNQQTISGLLDKSNCGDPFASHCLSLLYGRGTGVTKDTTKADELSRLACNQLKALFQAKNGSKSAS